MTSRFVAVEQDGVVEIHASGADASGDYATLCGVDGNDDGAGVNQRPADLPPGAKINCPQCKQLILAARKFSRRDFAI